jgi:hypothetical protein
MKLCPKCNVEHDKLGKYCSRKCANSRVFTDDSKLKKSKSVKAHYAANGTRPSPYKGIPRPAECIHKRQATWKRNTLAKFELGEIVERSTLRKVLTELYGYKCSCCGVIEWQGVQLTLQVDHVDGNAGNNMPSNLRLLCPNCHSITDTYCGKNKGRGRKSRGLKVY